MERPPNWPLKFLAWFCPPELHESIEGDLVEQFDADVSVHGVRRARRRFALNVLRFFHVEIILRNQFTIRLINTIMVGSYFTVALRNIQKRKLYSFINAFGLSIGIAFCMLIWLFIQDELSFDQFHENKSSIYRLEVQTYDIWNPSLKDEQRLTREAWLQMGILQAVKDECPEVVLGTRFGGSGLNVTYQDKIFNEKVRLVDADFFSMFSFPLLKGDPASVLKDKYSVVISIAVAEKFFGKEDPIGKTMTIDLDGSKSFTVTGVIENPPANSSLDYSMLARIDNRGNYKAQMESFGSFNIPIFVQLRSDADTAVFRRNLAMMCDKIVGPTLEQWKKDGAVPLPAGTPLMEYVFTPLPDIHMKKEVSWTKVSDIQYSYILGGIAFLILLIGSINYISLALTTSAARRTEVGIRKVVGAVYKQLLFQFAFESVVLAIISLVAAFALVGLFLPAFNAFTEKSISLMNTNLLMFTVVGLSLAIGVGAAAGSYPAIFLSRFKPAAVLKGRFATKLQAGFTRPLVVLQFAMSAFLIISSVIMYRQMKFISTKELGYNPEAVVIVSMQGDWNAETDRRYAQYRTELMRVSGVEDVAGTSISIADGYNINGFKVNDVNHRAYVYAVDTHYIPVLGLNLVSGRNFDPAIRSDSSAVIVNEALVKDMGWTDLSDAYLNWREDSASRGAKVIGVVKDYHYQSLESPINPMFMTMHGAAGHMTNAVVRISTTDIPSVTSQMESAWRSLFPDKPFAFSFLDDNVAKQYEDYERRMNIVGLSTLFAILISCLGLFGLAGVNAINRTKEIGIRKVMGADVKNIFIMLNRQYVWLSLIAFAVAMPVSWYVMDKWLAGFEFRTPIGWELFAASAAAGLAVALLTVSYHAVRASTINPAETLKYE